jgi:hypothetical protein
VLGSVVTLRERMDEPLPQLGLHALHTVHAPTAQFTGHGPEAHVPASDRAGQT